MTESIGRKRASVYAGEDPPQRPWPPRELLRQILTEGNDTHIAELLGRTRDEIRYQRQFFEIDSEPTGGSVDRRKERRQALWDRWAPRWQELGLTKEPQIY